MDLGNSYFKMETNMKEILNRIKGMAKEFKNL
jgi:hypothetical protein